MKATARFALLLLFSLSPGESQGGDRLALDVSQHLPVIWDELRGLNELVLSLKAAEVDRRQAQRRMESRLRDREVEAEQQRRSLAGLEETVVQQRERTDADRKRLLQLEEQRKGGFEPQQVWTRTAGSQPCVVFQLMCRCSSRG